MKRIFVVHGWESSSDEVWFPWLNEELENRGFQVTLLEMPGTEYPIIEKWVLHLSNSVGDVDNQTYFVGHSIGCQTILRYVEALPAGVKVGGAVLVAGFFHLTGVTIPDEILMVWPWINTPIDFDKIKTHTENFIAIFSDADEFVPLSNKKLFERDLGATTIVEHNMGHFNGKNNPKYKRVQVILESILKITNQP
jgi:predicted alpha/beta hydrolase family esterase